LMEFLTNKDIRRCIEKAQSSDGFFDTNKCTEANYVEETENCRKIISGLLDRHLVPGFKYGCEICLKVSPCTELPDETIEKSVYPGAIFMYFSDALIKTKYVRIYFWRV